MRRFFRSFRQLKWKLTASYTLVTLSTLVVFEIVLVIAGLVSLARVLEQLPELLAEQMINEAAPQVRPYLAGDAADLDGIHRWLSESESSGFEPLNGAPGLTININALDFPGSEAEYLVFDREGRLLGSADESAPLTSPQPFDVTSVENLEWVLPNALAGDSDTDDLSSVSSGGATTIAVPIRGTDGTVEGALVFSTPFTPISAIAGGLGIFVLGSVVVFTVLVGLLGTFFGFLTARGLTRRLNRVTAITTAWGAGDFSQTIQDRSADELGQLASQLNHMAVQLEELIEARQQLSALDERNRLARDLHDSVKQQVFAISMNLGAAQTLMDQDSAAARARLNTAFELARQSQQELTTIIQTLRPVELEERSLREALAETVSRWQAQTGITAIFEVKGDGLLPLALEDALFRVAQEALANTARHSHASWTRVALTAAGEQVTLVIQDNGSGFDTAQTSQGVGLRSMRERVEALGGRLDISSSQDGTVVIAQAPIKKEERR
jgi:NarL family two-component system sensor histidine kinase LiaS